MNRQDKRRYDRMISDVADRLFIDASREAFKITEGVFRDILTAFLSKNV
jgi:hypothetical protein